MRQEEAFTLVELLVVIAIISILAGIVVPQVTNWISRGRSTKALSEISNIELAVTALLADANKKSFNQFFNFAAVDNIYSDRYGALGDKFGDFWSHQSLARTVAVQTDIFYRLLRRGREAEVPLLQDVRKKLASSYMDLGTDPWGNFYQFYAGPWDPDSPEDEMYDEVLLLEPEFEDTSNTLYAIFNVFRARDADRDLTGRVIPGTIEDDAMWSEYREDGTPLHGFPADKNLPVYIFSMGQNLMVDQLYGPDYIEYSEVDGLPKAVWPAELRDQEYLGGGDDINNWDKTQSWGAFYR